MRGKIIETVMGAVVLVAAAFFLYFAYSTSQLRAVSGYGITANFDRIDGIHPGSDVRISGIKVGSVTATQLNPKTFLADVQMNIGQGIKLPEDTVAEIVSAGLLGDKYMSLVPGGSDKLIPPGGTIKYTQSSVNLENLVGQMIFSKPGGKGGKSGAPGGAGSAPDTAPSGAAPPPPPAGAPAK